MRYKKLTLLLSVFTVYATLTMVACSEPKPELSSANTSSLPNFTVSFNNSGEDSKLSSSAPGESGVIVTQTVKPGEKITKPIDPTDPTRKGRTFGGWYRDKKRTLPFFFATDTITKNLILYADWNPSGHYTVRFNPMGGSVIAKQTVEQGKKVTKPADPTRKDFTFGGWYTDSVSKIPFLFTTKITKNLTLYAVWNPSRRYTVQFNTDGGDDITKQTIKQKVTITFKVNRSSNNNSSWLLCRASHCGAPLPFTPKNEETIASKEVLLGHLVPKPDKPPTKKFAIFGGWYRNRARSKAFNFDKPITKDKDITLYAGWKYQWEAVSAGYEHTVGIKKNLRFLWKWGNNSGGHLGDGMTDGKKRPVRVKGGGTWKAVSAGFGHTVGIKEDGTLWGWGYNVNGQLGNGTTTHISGLVQVKGGGTWKAVSAGNYYTVGIKANRTLWAWGTNESGQLGDGTRTNKSSPVQVGSDEWKAVSAGNDHTVGIKVDGTLWGWGYNVNGQLGDGTKTDRSSPVQVGSDEWKVVSAGNRYTVGIKVDGTRWAWGWNKYGQLGDGTKQDRSSPVRMSFDGTWKAVSAGFEHTVGIKEDGTLWAWGSNEYGQLGDGTTDDKKRPVRVKGGGTWKAVSANDHTVGIKEDGTLWVWGDNRNGRLGDGTTKNRNKPVLIVER